MLFYLVQVFSPIKAFGKRNSAEFNDVENSVPGMQMQRALALQVQKVGLPLSHDLALGGILDCCVFDFLSPTNLPQYNSAQDFMS